MSVRITVNTTAVAVTYNQTATAAANALDTKIEVNSLYGQSPLQRKRKEREEKKERERQE